MAGTITFPTGTNIVLTGLGQFKIGGNGSFNTAGGALVGTFTLATGTAHQVSATKDCMIYFIATHAGKLTFPIGPTNAPTHKLFGTATSVAVGSVFCIRIPAGWYVKPVFATSAAFSAVTVVSC